jgi:hypothetical protein
VLTGAAGTDSCGAAVFCTSILLIVSTRCSLTAGETILFGCGTLGEGLRPHAAVKRGLLPSNNS